ncbi:hypothetical protein JYU14_02835 [Simkania negevensis]|uniref:Transmembrane protein n=1 Tax=Simkania negevensis TaxID=83561 RepID=A0ABS3ATN4_9BACT|nr:hypothetical protein [Simkania negevensis]
MDSNANPIESIPKTPFAALGAAFTAIGAGYVAVNQSLSFFPSLLIAGGANLMVSFLPEKVQRVAHPVFALGLFAASGFCLATGVATIPALIVLAGRGLHFTANTVFDKETAAKVQLVIGTLELFSLGGYCFHVASYGLGVLATVFGLAGIVKPALDHSKANQSGQPAYV